MRAGEPSFLVPKGGLDELQKLVAAEQRKHSLAAVTHAAASTVLAVFQSWKCNGLILSLDSAEANFVAQPVTLIGLN